jgi:hypothetical protein
MKNRSSLTALSLLVLAGCGGTTTSTARDQPDGSAGGSSSGGSSGSSSSSSGGSIDPGYDGGCLGPGTSHGGPRTAPAGHRAAAVPCTAGNPINCFNGDAGADLACASDADCAAPDGSFTWFTHCRHGTCAADECLADSDCATDHLCICSSGGGKECFHANVCVPANCHVDTDCGPGGFCTPSAGYCGSVLGFYCQKPADPCVDPNVDCDCPGTTIPACVYSPAGGVWVCGAAGVCAG